MVLTEIIFTIFSYNVSKNKLTTYAALFCKSGNKKKHFFIIPSNDNYIRIEILRNSMINCKRVKKLSKLSVSVTVNTKRNFLHRALPNHEIQTKSNMQQFKRSNNNDDDNHHNGGCSFYYYSFLPLNSQSDCTKRLRKCSSISTRGRDRELKRNI